MNDLDVTIHGDRLEREFGDIINNHLPAYNKIWSLYIGNDGQSKMPVFTHLPAEEARKRQIFSQYHYSCFESIVSLKVICEKVKDFKIKNDISDYIQVNNDFMAFQAPTGRIIDCLEKVGASMGMPDLAKDLIDYYKQRNNILHGCKIPFSIIEGYLAIPQIKGTGEDAMKWNDKMSWDDVNQNDFDFLEDYMNVGYMRIVPEVNSALSRLITNVSDLVEKLKIKISTPLTINTNPDTSACVLLFKPLK